MSKKNVSQKELMRGPIVPWDAKKRKVSFTLSMEDLSTVNEEQQIIKIFSHPIID